MRRGEQAPSRQCAWRSCITFKGTLRSLRKGFIKKPDFRVDPGESRTICSWLDDFQICDRQLYPLADNLTAEARRGRGFIGFTVEKLGGSEMYKDLYDWPSNESTANIETC
jgi:hypothetical protein